MSFFSASVTCLYPKPDGKQFEFFYNLLNEPWYEKLDLFRLYAFRFQKKEKGFVFLTHGDFSVFENAGHIQSKDLKQVNQLKSH